MSSPPAYAPSPSVFSPIRKTKSENLPSSGKTVESKTQYKLDIADARDTRQKCLDMMKEFTGSMPEEYQEEWTELIHRYRRAARLIDGLVSKQDHSKGKIAWYRFDAKITLRKELAEAAAKIKGEFDYIEKKMDTLSFRAIEEDAALRAAGVEPVEYDGSSIFNRTILTAEALNLPPTEAEKLATARRREERATGAQNSAQDSPDLPAPSPPADAGAPAQAENSLQSDDADAEESDTSSDSRNIITVGQNGDIQLKSGDQDGGSLIAINCKRFEAGDIPAEEGHPRNVSSPVPLEPRNSWADSISSLSTR